MRGAWTLWQGDVQNLYSLSLHKDCAEGVRSIAHSPVQELAQPMQSFKHKFVKSLKEEAFVQNLENKLGDST